MPCLGRPSIRSRRKTIDRAGREFDSGLPTPLRFAIGALPTARRSFNDRRRSAARVAQLVEHMTENHGVGGSIPSPGTSCRHIAPKKLSPTHRGGSRVSRQARSRRQPICAGHGPSCTLPAAVPTSWRRTAKAASATATCGAASGRSDQPPGRPRSASGARAGAPQPSGAARGRWGPDSQRRSVRLFGIDAPRRQRTCQRKPDRTQNSLV